MTDFVVDASVVAKWFFSEEYSEEAKVLLAIDFRLLAPDLMPIEVASIAWKRVRRGEISAKDAIAIGKDLETLPIEIIGSSECLETALEIAIASDRSVYDSLYLALASACECVFVTADTRLVNALSASDYTNRVRHVSSIK